MLLLMYSFLCPFVQLQTTAMVSCVFFNSINCSWRAGSPTLLWGPSFATQRGAPAPCESGVDAGRGQRGTAGGPGADKGSTKPQLGKWILLAGPRGSLSTGVLREDHLQEQGPSPSPCTRWCCRRQRSCIGVREAVPVFASSLLSLEDSSVYFYFSTFLESLSFPP